jgi:hypothetical protein
VLALFTVKVPLVALDDVDQPTKILFPFVILQLVASHWGRVHVPPWSQDTDVAHVPVPLFLFNVIFTTFWLHCAVRVLFSVYSQLNPAETTVVVPLTNHPVKLYPVLEQVFAAGVNVVLYVAVASAGFVPVPVPHEYVTVYVFAVLHA